jgi:hypothetical protein
MFPSNGSLNRRPLPSTGSLWFGSPASSVLRDAQTPCRSSGPVSLPSPGRYHRSRRGLLPTIATHDRGHRGVDHPVPEPELTVETAGPPRFLGNPFVPMPCSGTPAGSETPGHCGVPTWPPLVSTTKAPTSEGFGARSHGLGTGCLRFVKRIAPPHARLASGCSAKPGRAGLTTRRVATKGFRVRVSSPFPRLAWRYDTG